MPVHTIVYALICLSVSILRPASIQADPPAAIPIEFPEAWNREDQALMTRHFRQQGLAVVKPRTGRPFVVVPSGMNLSRVGAFDAFHQSPYLPWQSSGGPSANTPGFSGQSGTYWTLDTPGNPHTAWARANGSSTLGSHSRTPLQLSQNYPIIEFDQEMRLAVRRGLNNVPFSVCCRSGQDTLGGWRIPFDQKAWNEYDQYAQSVESPSLGDMISPSRSGGFLQNLRAGAGTYARDLRNGMMPGANRPMDPGSILGGGTGVLVGLPTTFNGISNGGHSPIAGGVEAGVGTYLTVGGTSLGLSGAGYTGAGYAVGTIAGPAAAAVGSVTWAGWGIYRGWTQSPSQGYVPKRENNGYWENFKELYGWYD